MAKLDKDYFNQKAMELILTAQQFNLEYQPCSRMARLALNPFFNAVLAAARAAQSLASLVGNISGNLMEGLVSEAAAEIAVIELMVARVDVDKAKSDAAYAGRLTLMETGVVQQSQVAVLALSAALTSLVEAHKQCALARDSRKALNDPARPKHKYAVGKVDFRHQDDGGHVAFFEKGQHCLIDWEGPDGRIRVEHRDWSVPLTGVQVAQYFDIVEA